MNIVIAGGTGLIGSHLIKKFTSHDNHIYILTRSATNKKATTNITYINWLTEGAEPEKELDDIDVFINLAGASINSRWTDQQKQRILSSRIEATQNCISLMKKLSKKPKVFLNASAVGYYGTSFSNVYTEESRESGTDFLASVVQKWEQEALKAEELGIRTVLLRFGVILADDGGALTKMLLPYKLFIGGTIGTGEQWLSWVHIEDAINMIDYAIYHENISGPLNVTAPTPVQMKQFGETLGTVLKRPHWIPVPAFILKLLLGEMSLLVVEGQKVIPKKAVDNGFNFQFSNISEALKSLNL